MRNSAFKVFGIPMERRQSRRRLVAVTYVFLAAVCAASTAVAGHYPSLYGYAVWSALGVSLLVFGGQGQRGLLKDFANKPPRPPAPQVEMIRLQLAPKTMLPADDSAWRNDERELHRRDLAHYTAFQPLSIGVMLLLALAAIALRSPQWFSPRALLIAIFGVAEAMTMLVFTLPAAIILWTEPDIDADLNNPSAQERKEALS